MTLSKIVALLMIVSGACAGPAAAQSRGALAASDVIGDWSLVITPEDRNGVEISIESRDGEPMDWPLTIESEGGNRLSCVVRARPGQCRIADGGLTVVSSSASGGATITFDLAERTSSGLRGTARMRVRFMPFVGGQIGVATMTPR